MQLISKKIFGLFLWRSLNKTAVNVDTLDSGGWVSNSSGVPYDGAPNEEYWGIVDIERNKKEAFHIVKTKYLNLSKTNELILKAK